MTNAQIATEMAKKAEEFQAIHDRVKPRGFLTTSTAVEVILYSPEFDVETRLPLLLTPKSEMYLKADYEPEEVGVLKGHTLDAEFDAQLRQMVEGSELSTHQYRGYNENPSFWREQAELNRTMAEVFRSMG